jgi:Domain of unknown function (DUF4183)
LKDDFRKCKSNVKSYPPPLLMMLPKFPSKEVRVVCPRKVQVFEYSTIGNSQKRIYKNEDALVGYGIQKILSPFNFSYMNLFINGVLQPTSNYILKEGKLILLTDDLPLDKSPIILQMIKVL